jgi:plasmid stabilization system protein ParE
MKVEFTNRAVSDLREISDYSRKQFGDRVTAALEARIRDVIADIASAPERAPAIEQRSGMRIVPLVHYPFKIFSSCRRRGQDSAYQARRAPALGLWRRIASV